MIRESFQGLLAFMLVVADDDRSNVTSHAGVPLVIEALRAVVPNRIYRRLRKALGYKQWRAVRRHLESLVVLMVAGGDHVSDIDALRADRGLARLLGFKPSSPTQLREFLYRFHQADDGRPLTKDDDAVLSVKGEANIRPEGPALRLLGLLCDEVVRQVQRDHQCLRATIDVDATIIEALKGEALKAYEAGRTAPGGARSPSSPDPGRQRSAARAEPDPPGGSGRCPDRDAGREARVANLRLISARSVEPDPVGGW